MSNPPRLFIAELRERYRTGLDTPRAVVEQLLNTDPDDPYHVWITRLTRTQVLAHVAALDPARFEELPLYGIPFVIKDNIDLADVPTTAACPGFSYTPTRSATVVEKLIAAGAIPMGKTNLDQFATGLVGVRSPYGACRNGSNPDFISGGSSSGSAVAVARGLASFSLGTDTAGSGRVPAAFNNIVGVKPSNGRLSTRGVVPACRSIDCVSLFALTVEDAATVLAVAEGFDGEDPFSRRVGNRMLDGLRVGVPRPEQLQFFGDAEYEKLFHLAADKIGASGATLVTIDFSPFLEAARLLYDGPWVAERYAAVGRFLEMHPEALHPVTKTIIEGARRFDATSAFNGLYRLRELERAGEATWAQADLLLTPTAGTIYTVKDVESDPIRLNANLGYYTNFMNLFDLSGVAIPAGFRADAMPFGVTLVGPRGADRELLRVGGGLHRASVNTVGAMGLALSATPPEVVGGTGTPLEEGFVAMAVCGAHMGGLPLNHQLRERGGYLLEATRTAPHYRLFALPGGPPRRPGLIRVARDGLTIELEVWALRSEHIGSFIAGIPAPLGVGRVELESGTWVTGFICEGFVMETSADVSSYGGWRGYIQATSV